MSMHADRDPFLQLPSKCAHASAVHRPFPREQERMRERQPTRAYLLHLIDLPRRTEKKRQVIRAAGTSRRKAEEGVVTF